MTDRPNHINEEPTPPRQNEDEIDDTINEDNEVDEASLESFPASDPPAYTGTHASTVDPAQERADADKKR